MRTLMAKRVKKGAAQRKTQLLSDHYTFMYELMRRVKPQLKRLLEAGSLSHA